MLGHFISSHLYMVFNTINSDLCKFSSSENIRPRSHPLGQLKNNQSLLF